jgi:mannose-6-phosphate isomerase-like protein (cupin superfamily)
MRSAGVSRPSNTLRAGQPEDLSGDLAAGGDELVEHVHAARDHRASLQTPLDVHHREDEGFHVLEGSVTIDVGDQTVELAAGQHAFGPRNIPHRFTVGRRRPHDVGAHLPTVPPASVLPPEDAAEIVLRHSMKLLDG